MAGDLKKCRKAMFVAAVAVVAIAAAFFSGERYISSTRFCLSCHAMSYPYERLRKSAHYGPLGVDPGCKDCHLPPQFFLRMKTHAIDGVTDMIGVYRYGLSTKEAFDRHKEEFAARARAELRAWGCSPCKTCHKNPVPTSAAGKLAHEEAGAQNMTCVDCHQNLVH